MTARVDITALLAALRARRVDVGVDDHVRCARLIASAGDLSDDDLRLALRALLSRGGAAEEAFDRSWAELSAPPAMLAAPRPAVSVRRRRRSRWWAVPAGALVAIAAGIALHLIPAPPEPPAPPPPVAGDEPTAPEDPPAALALDPGILIPSGRLGTEEEDRRDSAPIAPPPPAWALWVPWIAALAALAALALALSLRRARGRALRGPHTFAPRIEPAARERIFARPELERAADALSAPSELEEEREWDVERTVDATARAAGMPVFVPRRADRGLPTLIVLERAARWRPIVDAMIDRLRALGTRIEVVEWDGRWDRVIDGARSVPWHEASARVARVIVIAERAPPSRWRGGRAAARVLWASPSVDDGDDDRGVATPDGIGRLVRGDDAPPRPGAPLGRIAVLRPASDAGLDELRDHLGERGWAALALATQWEAPDATLAVVLARSAGVVLDAETTARLATLPWMSEAEWPEGLARAVRARAPEELLERGREAWQRMLAASEPEAESGAHLSWQLERALAGGDRRALRSLASAPIASVAQERARELGTSMPRSRRWLTSRALGWASACAAIVAAIALVPPLLARSRTSTPEGLEDACEDGSGPACLALGVRIARGADGEIDPARAVSLFGGACERGVAHACTRSGRAVLAIGNVEDAARAFGYACEYGDERACAERACAAVPELRQIEVLSARWEQGELDLVHELAWRKRRLLEPVSAEASGPLRRHLIEWLARYDAVASGERAFVGSPYAGPFEAGGYLFASDDPERVPFPEEAADELMRSCQQLWSSRPAARTTDCDHPDRADGCAGRVWPAWPAGERRRWLGRWSGSNARFAFELELVHEGGAVEGELRWRALGGIGNAPGRIGDTAIERLEGTWTEGDRTLVLRGVERSDSTLIGLDQYRLALASDGAVTGNSRTSSADWHGELIAWPADRIPALENVRCADVIGSYRLTRVGETYEEGAPMRIRRDGDELVFSGDGWTGRGRIDGASGRYDWEFEDGREGHTLVRVIDGMLHGEVIGPGLGPDLNWRYIARRDGRLITWTPCGSIPTIEVSPSRPVAGSPVTITVRTEPESEQPSLMVLDSAMAIVASLRPGSSEPPGTWSVSFTFARADRYRIQLSGEPSASIEVEVSEATEPESTELDDQPGARRRPPSLDDASERTPSAPRIVPLEEIEVTPGEAEPAARTDAGVSREAAVRECVMQGNNACVIRLLEGNAQTDRELGYLIEAYRARGQTQPALRHMRTYVSRFPGTSRARGYQQILSRQTIH